MQSTYTSKHSGFVVHASLHASRCRLTCAAVVLPSTTQEGAPNSSASYTASPTVVSTEPTEFTVLRNSRASNDSIMWRVSQS